MNLQQVSLEMLCTLLLLLADSIAAASTSSSFSALSASPTGSVCPSAAAYEFPIRNVSLEDGKSKRGIAVSVGTPGQALAFHLARYVTFHHCSITFNKASELNNTYIFDNVTESNIDGCDDASEAVQCYTQLGGYFNETASTSFSWAPERAPFSTAVEDPSINPHHKTNLWANDVLTMAPIKGVSDFPLGISRGEGEWMNTIGLGRNSTLLNALVINGDIAARVWGFWQGWSGDYQHHKDGSLVLGGYDVNKTIGPNITIPTNTVEAIDINCFPVTVTDIKMDLTNGSSFSLFGSVRGTAKRACVNPSGKFSSLELSNDLWDEFLLISQNTFVKRTVNPFAFWSMLIEADGA